MITEDYVSFETAKLLKEKGFYGKCFSMYVTPQCNSGNGDPNKAKIAPHGRDSNYYDGYMYQCEAPTLQMAMKWLREEHDIHIELNPICTGDSNEDLEWHYGWAVRTTLFTDRWKRHDAEHISYEEACEAAIKYCLENLI